MASNIMNAIRNAEYALWTWRCSCGEKGLTDYSNTYAALSAGRRIHGNGEKCRDLVNV